VSVVRAVSWLVAVESCFYLWKAGGDGLRTDNIPIISWWKETWYHRETKESWIIGSGAIWGVWYD
jgi:hypothetical protein